MSDVNRGEFRTWGERWAKSLADRSGWTAAREGFRQQVEEMERQRAAREEERQRLVEEWEEREKQRQADRRRLTKPQGDIKEENEAHANG